MSDMAIHVEGLGKQYRIGRQQARYRTLRETLVDAAGAPARRLRRAFRAGASSDTDDTIWALRDVSFDVRQGEAIGIIGRNGAGKSTLLKILSRITKPTEGRVSLSGRVGSLLEVGTGFHPELTGRENIYLNGAILGMRRAEILRRFEEIVAFAEIGPFLDTPVKHYSSGMYVRLAFAVAAHLEPEILVVDEVLAVGDAFFQRKCLGKMGDLAGQGRTVVLVSHNIGALVTMCSRCLWIDKGILVQDGEVREVTSRYQASAYSSTWDDRDLSQVPHYGTGKARFVSAHIVPVSKDGGAVPFLQSGNDLRVELTIQAFSETRDANVALIFYDAYGYRLIDVNTALQGSFLSLRPGEGAVVIFELRDLLLKPGLYLLGLWLGRASVEDIDGITHAGSVMVEPDPNSLQHTETFPGPYQCRYTHSVQTFPVLPPRIVVGS